MSKERTAKAPIYCLMDLDLLNKAKLVSDKNGYPSFTSFVQEAISAQIEKEVRKNKK